MIKCDNCTAEAEYVSEPPYASTAYFCSACVPWSLINDLRAGLLPRVAPQGATAIEDLVVDSEPVLEEPVVETTPAPSKKKKTADSVEEPGASDVSDN